MCIVQIQHNVAMKRKITIKMIRLIRFRSGKKGRKKLQDRT